MYGALGCGRMIGQPAADNHYTTSLSRQARKPVVRQPWNGNIHSNAKGVFLCNTFFCRPTKESMKISHTAVKKTYGKPCNVIYRLYCIDNICKSENKKVLILLLVLP